MTNRKLMFLLIIGLFLGISTDIDAQIKGSYWWTMQTTFRAKVDYAQSGLFGGRLGDRVYQNTILKGGYFVADRMAFGGGVEWHNGVDYTGIINSFSWNEYNGQTVHLEAYMRNYLVNKQRFLLTSEIGGGVHRINLDWTEEAIDRFAGGGLSGDIYYGPKSLAITTLVDVGFGIRINANAVFLLNLNTQWSIYSEKPLANDSGNWNVEPYAVGLHARVEYYFTSDKRTLYQYFQKPFEQQRSYWEANGALFGRNRESGVNLHVAHGRHYRSGISTRFWISAASEDRLIPQASVNTGGIAIYKHQSLKKMENTFLVWGGSLGVRYIDNDGIHPKTEVKTMLEYWQANRLRFAVGSTAAIMSGLASYEWVGRVEMEYFFAPNFSWQASVVVPFIQDNLSKKARDNVFKYKRREGNTTQVAARMWF